MDEHAKPNPSENVPGNETEQVYKELFVLMKVFSPDLTEEEIEKFLASTRLPQAYKGIEVQRQRAAWLQERLAAIHERGEEGPQRLGYEVDMTNNGLAFLPVFSQDSEFQVISYQW